MFTSLPRATKRKTMKTLVQGITFTIGLLAFCGLLAWIESTPVSDAPVHQFADAFTGIINLLGL
jgi:hypothetical protein